MSTHTFTFADGRTAVVRLAVNDERGTGWRQTSLDAVVGIDEDEQLIAEDGFQYALTDCCGGSFKGCDSYVGCRACYREVEGGGMPWGVVTPVVR